MSATDRQKVRFRLRLGGDDISMPDEYIDGLFDDAAEAYPTASNAIIYAASVLEGAKNLKAAAANEVDYSANTASEKLSQRFDHLASLVADCQAEFDTVYAVPRVSAAWGGLKKIPPPVRRYPSS